MSQRKLSGAGVLLWMSVMNGVLDTASSSSSSSMLWITHCVVKQYTSITCYWETNHTDSSYRLQIKKITCDSLNQYAAQNSLLLPSCDTKGSHCSVQPIDSTIHCFHAEVLINTSIHSLPYFFRGTKAEKLPPPLIKELRPSATRSDCLEVIWKMPSKRDDIQLQMEYITHGQTRSQTIKLSRETLCGTASCGTVELCDLYGGSVYTVRLRAQDDRPSVYWSSWTSVDNKTAERAPSVAPQLWRVIQPAGEAGKRRLTLLWKAVPWPEVNGVVLSYSASCRGDLDSSQWSCGALNASRRFCVLNVSEEPCDCSLTAHNSAGTSPPAHIHIPAHPHTEELPPPETLNVTSLDDTQLKVEWTVTLNQSESGFVLQWTSVPYKEPTSLNWEYVNKTSRSFILTGLLPEVPYNLSVVILYGRRTGSDLSVIAFTREGAPSAGPAVTVQKTSSSLILLKWEPVPLETLHGFIQHYTVIYSINGKDRSVRVNADTHQLSLTGLSEGIYTISVSAHTAAGGAAGPWQRVALGDDDVQVIPIMLCAILGTFLILTIPVCLRVRIKQCLCPTVPDPSQSSLSSWTKTCQQRQLTSTLGSIVSGPAPGCVEKDYVPVQVFAFHTVDTSEAETKTYSGSSVISYLDPFPSHLLNQNYTKPQAAELFFESLFSNRTNQEDFCGYVQMPQTLNK